MSEVEVNSESISKLIKLCIASQSELEKTTTNIQKQYKELGNTWKDNKYKEFGEILDKSCGALKQPLSELKRCELFLKDIYEIIAEYESITFGNAQNREQTSSRTGNTQGTLGANGFWGIFSSIFSRNKDIYKALKGVEHRPIMASTTDRTEEQIIGSISGGDMTEGSCSSLALAYVGNRAGYVVYDFRDGQSRETFSSRDSINQIAHMQGVNSVVINGTNDLECAERLISNMERGTEYYLATGEHAAIVRLNNDGNYQYLELQSEIPSDNGWQPLTQRALYDRFGCDDNHRTEWSNYLINTNSLQNNAEFLNLLGYINTAESAQIRGAQGHAR